MSAVENGTESIQPEVEVRFLLVYKIHIKWYTKIRNTSRFREFNQIFGQISH